MARGARKELNQIIDALYEQGFTVEPTGGCHYKVKKDGRTVYTMPSTPGEGRAIKNIISALRRVGFVWKGR